MVRLGNPYHHYPYATRGYCWPNELSLILRQFHKPPPGRGLWNHCCESKKGPILALNQLPGDSRFKRPISETDFRIFSSRKMASSPSDRSSNSEEDSKPNVGGTNTKPKFSATKEELKARLSPIQYQVTQLKSTER